MSLILANDCGTQKYTSSTGGVGLSLKACETSMISSPSHCLHMLRTVCFCSCSGFSSKIELCISKELVKYSVQVTCQRSSVHSGTEKLNLTLEDLPNPNSPDVVRCQLYVVDISQS